MEAPLNLSLARPTKEILCPKTRHPEQVLEIECNEKLRTFFKKPNYYILFRYARRDLISLLRAFIASVDISHTFPTPPNNPAPYTISDHLASSHLHFMRIKHCPVAVRTAEAGEQISLDRVDLAILGAEPVLACSKTMLG